MDEELENSIKEKLDELYEEEEPRTDDSTADDSRSRDNADGETKPEEEFKADSLEDFLKKTNTKISVKKEGCMPSPIFGNRDQNNHNKYRITIKNEKGSTSFVFWDSINNTAKNKPLDANEAFYCFGRDIEAIQNSTSFEEFKSNCGYGETEDNLAQKAYNGCRKELDRAKKLFDENQLKELIRLVNEG